MVCGVTLIVCALLTIMMAVVLLRKVCQLKSFNFLSTQLGLMIAYEVTVLCQGSLWIANVSYFFNHDNMVPWLCVGIILEMVAVCSVLMMFWKLAFMYFLSSRQLMAWVHAATISED